MWDPYAEFETVTLPNGLTIHATEWPGREWQEFGLVIHTGSGHDPPGVEGVAHYVEHLISSNGTMSLQQIVEFFDRSGGSVNLGLTYLDHTRYYFCSPTAQQNIERGLDIFGELLLGNRLEKAVEAQRLVILEEFNRAFPRQFDIDSAKRMSRVVFAGTPLENFLSGLGNRDSIGRMTQENLQSHYDRHYQPANMSIVSVGGMKVSQLVEFVAQSRFGTVRGGSRTPAVPLVQTLKPLSETNCFYELSKLDPPIPQNSARYFNLTRLPGTTPTFLVKLAAKMWRTQLFEEVRERLGWTYSIGVTSQLTQGFHSLEVLCGSFSPKVADQMGPMVDTCREDVAHQVDLFDRFKDTMIAQKKMVDMSGSSLCRCAINDLIDRGRIVSFAEEIEEIKNIRFEDARDLLLSLPTDQRWTSIRVP